MRFNDNFTLENIKDDILVHMFDNISDIIQQIDGNKDFIIIHRVSDNWMFKSYLYGINDNSDDSFDEYENTYSNKSDQDNESDDVNQSDNSEENSTE